jgi:hypothetical protein
MDDRGFVHFFTWICFLIKNLLETSHYTLLCQIGENLSHYEEMPGWRESVSLWRNARLERISLIMKKCQVGDYLSHYEEMPGWRESVSLWRNARLERISLIMKKCQVGENQSHYEEMPGWRLSVSLWRNARLERISLIMKKCQVGDYLSHYEEMPGWRESVSLWRNARLERISVIFVLTTLTASEYLCVLTCVTDRYTHQVLMFYMCKITLLIILHYKLRLAPVAASLTSHLSNL